MKNFVKTISQKFKKARGFTLMEILIVLIIIGIIAAFVYPQLTGALAKSRNTARKIAISQIQSALDTYMSDYSKYPSKLQDLVPQYMKEIPKDPKFLSSTCPDDVKGISYMLNDKANATKYALGIKMEKEGNNKSANVSSCPNSTDLKVTEESDLAGKENVYYFVTSEN